MLGHKVFGSGLSGLATQAISADVAIGLTAAGTNQATALALTNAVNAIATAAADTGVLLYAGSAGDSQMIYNGALNPVKVYPPSGAQVNGLATNTAFILPINTAVDCVCLSATNWFAILSA